MKALPGFRELTDEEYERLIGPSPYPVPAGLSRCTAVEINKNGKAVYCDKLVIDEREAERNP